MALTGTPIPEEFCNTFRCACYVQECAKAKLIEALPRSNFTHLKLLWKNTLASKFGCNLEVVATKGNVACGEGSVAGYALLARWPTSCFSGFCALLQAPYPGRSLPPKPPVGRHGAPVPRPTQCQASIHRFKAFVLKHSSQQSDV